MWHEMHIIVDNFLLVINKLLRMFLFPACILCFIINIVTTDIYSVNPIITWFFTKSILYNIISILPLFTKLRIILLVARSSHDL